MSDDLSRLLVDLAKAGPKAQAASYAAVKVEAYKMRSEWQDAVKGSRRLRGLPAAVGYDILPTGLLSIAAEVGYDQRGQGELGNIAEFGTSTQGPVMPAGAKVLKGGADRLEKYLGGLDPL